MFIMTKPGSPISCRTLFRILETTALKCEIILIFFFNLFLKERYGGNIKVNRTKTVSGLRVFEVKGCLKSKKVIYCPRWHNVNSYIKKGNYYRKINVSSGMEI